MLVPMNTSLGLFPSFLADPLIMLSPLTRDETILILNALGVDIMADTKLLDDIPEKRLPDALSAARYKDRLPEVRI